MRELTHIVLVNWYLFGAKDIPIRGDTAVIGANAAGKSSLLDAIQTVLTGNHGTFLKLNATSERSERSVFDYCLGQVADKRLGHPPLRDSALTYIVLTFTDPNGRPCSIGVALAARRGDDDEQTLARFIAPGVRLQTGDFVDPSPAGTVPRPWPAVRERLRATCKDFEEYKAAELFVREMLKALGRPGYYAEARRFLKSFQNALRFSPIDDPTEFIRKYILEPNPVEIARFRQSRSRYLAFVQKIEALERELKSIEDVGKAWSTYVETDRRARISEWLGRRARLEVLDAGLRAARARLAEVEAAEAAIVGELAKIGRLRTRYNEQLNRLRLRRDTSEPAMLLKENELAATRLQAERIAAIEPLVKLRAAMGRVGLVLQHPSLIGSAAPSGVMLLQTLKRLAHGAELDADWPADPAAVDQAAARRRELAPVIDILARTRDDDLAAIARMKDERAALERQIGRIGQGASPLSDNAERFYDRLSREGFEPRPLCAVVGVADEAWQPTVEAILGSDREAMLVPRRHAEAAVKFMRRHGKEFPGCRIIDTLETARLRPDVDPRGLARVLRTDDADARAFLDQRLGRIIMVTTEAEIFAHRTAATQDMVHKAGSIIKRLRPPPYFILGREVQLRTRGLMEARYRELGDEIAADAKRAQICTGLLAQLDAFALAAEALGGTVADIRRRVLEIDRRSAELAAEREALQQRQDPELLREISEHEAQLQELDAEETAWGEKRRANDKAHGQVSEQIARLTQERLTLRPVLLQARRRLRDGHDGPAAIHAAKRELKLAVADGRLGPLGETALRSAADARGLVGRHFEIARRALADHAHAFQLVPPFDERAPVATVIDWIAREVARIRDNALIDYRAQAQRALEEMTTVFKQDFVSELKKRFDDVRRQIDTLNRQLEARRFQNNERYRFKAELDPGKAAIVHLVLDARNIDLGPLFEGKDIGRAEHAAAARTISALITDEKVDAREFEDYRQYYTFDLQMIDEQGGVRSSLRSRLTIGSGGERHTPFYVAIAASLAATLNGPEPVTPERPAGMALAVFDEAFSNLDAENIGTCLGFLKQIGLQTIVAAPDDAGKRASFVAHMRTIIDIYRDGTAVDLEIAHPGAKIQELLRRESPYAKGVDAFRAPSTAAGAS